MYFRLARLRTARLLVEQGIDCICQCAMLQMDKDLAQLTGSDGGKLAPVSEFPLDAAAVLSRTPSKAASLGR
jgi:hypothetical protein